MAILPILLTITGIFFLMLIAKRFLSYKTERNFCAICIAVSMTWILLFALYKLKYFNNNVIIGLLMGQSVIGIYYLAERKTIEEYKIFRLPLLLTLTIIAYLLLEIPDDIGNVLMFLGVLWIAFIILYAYRNNKNASGLVKKIIDCCRNW